MAAQDLVLIDVAGVAGITGDVRRRVAEAVVVVAQRHDARPPLAPDLAAPRRHQRIDGNVDEHLDGMGPSFWISQIANRQIALELVWGQDGRHRSPPVGRRSRATTPQPTR